MAFLTSPCGPPHWHEDALQHRLVTLILDDAVCCATNGTSGAMLKIRDLVYLQDEIGCQDKEMMDRLLQAVSMIGPQAADDRIYTAAMQLVDLLCAALSLG